MPPCLLRPGLAGLVLLTATCGGGRNAPGGPVPMASAGILDAEASDLLVRLRKATAPFRDFNKAVAAGYGREIPDCVEHPPHGAMGFHHANPRYVDTRLDVERPEILTYERDAEGRYSLTGAEYIVPYRLWPRDSTPPAIFGRPLKRADVLQIWYLHVWAWKENPAGLFDDWNPTIRCPVG